MDIKEKILKLLYDAGGSTVSGVVLSRRLDISRVAVWKHINALRENGFDIASNSKGYCIENPDDLLLPFCFETALQDKIFYFTEIETTMDEARALARKGAPHLSAVIAENQRLGRGRLNRKWFSSRGGLWFTLILKPAMPPVMAYIYNFAASLSLATVLRQMYRIDVFVKWPNDLLVNGKKLCGLLSEMDSRGDMIEFLNIGIGLNVNNHPEKDEPAAISLCRVIGRPVSRKQILEAFIKDFSRQIQDIDTDAIIQKWKRMTSTIGSRVRIQTLKDTFEGRALDVDASGALIIEKEDGARETIIYGDCFHA